MHRTIYPTLCCVCALFFVVPATATQEVSKTEVLALSAVAAVTARTDWKQANQKVAELGGWQFYANEAGSHQGMNHSSHGKAMDHSKHSMPMDHSSHGKAMDHSKHSMPMDHSKHLAPQPAKKGDEHEHHH